MNMRVSTQQSYVSMTQSFNDLSSDLSHVVDANGDREKHSAAV
jgi:flagellar hook-associated protein 3 FlgL